jgi:hypothetical protein
VLSGRTADSICRFLQVRLHEYESKGKGAGVGRCDDRGATLISLADGTKTKEEVALYEDVYELWREGISGDIVMSAEPVTTTLGKRTRAPPPPPPTATAGADGGEGEGFASGAGLAAPPASKRPRHARRSVPYADDRDEADGDDFDVDDSDTDWQPGAKVAAVDSGEDEGGGGSVKRHKSVSNKSKSKERAKPSPPAAASVPVDTNLDSSRHHRVTSGQVQGAHRTSKAAALGGVADAIKEATAMQSLHHMVFAHSASAGELAHLRASMRVIDRLLNIVDTSTLDAESKKSFELAQDEVKHALEPAWRGGGGGGGGSWAGWGPQGYGSLPGVPWRG